MTRGRFGRARAATPAKRPISMPTLTPEGLTELKLKANDVRQGIIRSLLAAGSGHSAGPLDMSDVFTALYGSFAASRSAQSRVAGSRPSPAFMRAHRAGAIFGDGELRLLSDPKNC